MSPPRSLCVDALIELSDENADWKLSFDEFLNCLKPGFNPPEKSEPEAAPANTHMEPFFGCYVTLLLHRIYLNSSMEVTETQRGHCLSVFVLSTAGGDNWCWSQSG